MKKLLISALAVLAFTACSQDEVVEQSQLQASAVIAFDGAFVDNATRAADPSTTTESIKEFSVWGFMDEAGGDVFNNEKVTKGGSEWSYTNLQYWVPNHTYYFAALSPIVTENGDVKVTEATTTEALQLGLGTVEFTNKDGKTDLIYAATTATTTEDNYLTMPKVGLTFNHLLSKVKFTFKNGFVNENNTITIKNLKMKAPGAGAINLATSDWWTSPDKWTLTENKEVTLDFGDVNEGNEIKVGESKDCANERLTIPAVATQKYEVTFDVVLYSGTVEAYTRAITTYVEGVALEMGNAYNFTATLDYTNIAENVLKPIEFEVTTVKTWDEAGDFKTTLSNVTVNAGETLTLTSDAVVKPSTFKVNGVLNGAGHTIKAVDVTGTQPKMVHLNAAGASVTNLTIDGEENFTYNLYVSAKGGTCSIDNVKSINGTYALNVQGKTPTTINITNSELAGWVSYSSYHTVNFTNVYFYKGAKQGYFYPHSATTLTNCKFKYDFTIDVEKVSELNKNITFDNCFVVKADNTEEKITKDNISNLLTVVGTIGDNVTFK